MKPRSLHGRLIVGAVIWSLGILAVATVLAFAVVSMHPRQALFVHNSMLILAGGVLVTAGVSVIRRGLSPFQTLHERLAAVRDGRTPRLEGDYPTEVVPLVNDLNTLLEEREKRVARAAAKAGDLAHGLKTPLAIIAQDLTRLEAAGQQDLADAMRRQVERMRRQIDWHLAHARATASGARAGARANVLQAARGLARTMERLHAGRALLIMVDAAPDLDAHVPMEDLEEMIGNLFDNACKWAKTRVTVSANRNEAAVVILVDDDGAGLDETMWEPVLRRGVRVDEAADGSGLGLAIVRDLAEAYGGSVALGRSSGGGVQARLTLPG